MKNKKQRRVNYYGKYKQETWSELYEKADALGKKSMVARYLNISYGELTRRLTFREIDLNRVVLSAMKELG